MRKRLVCILLAVFMALGVAACGDDGKSDGNIVLSAPTNLRIIDQGDRGLVHWDSVKYAQSYIVTVNGAEHSTDGTSWTIQPLTIDYTVSVVACRKGVKNSAAASVSFAKHPVSVVITGGSECRSGKTLQLTATVKDTDNQNVVWSIVAGGEYAEISVDGLLTAKNVSGDKIVRVRATSVFDSSAYAEKVLTITAKPELTQEMLDELDADKLAFEGFLEIEQWTASLPERLVGSVTLSVSTAMDGERWFSEYDDLNAKRRYEYVEDRADVQSRPSTACRVSVDLDNTVKTTPVLDSNGDYIAWADSVYNNCLRELSVSEFEFNESNWRWEYKGNGNIADKKAAMQAIVASAHKTGFTPKNMYLIVEEGSVAGLYSESEDDYGMYTGYKVRMKLTSALNVGETVNVGTLSAYAHEDMHDELQAAIDKMKALDNYTTECLDSSNTQNGGTVYNGYVETITPEACYMRPFIFTPTQASLIEIGGGLREFSDMDFGYVKCDDGLYNSFRVNDGVFSLYRAYAGSYEEQALPSFDFAAEIFTKMLVNADGSKTYYVDKLMTSVATAFYHGLDNDMAIYGIFANPSYRAKAYLPFVTVGVDGYITNAGFSYYMGSFYGDLKFEYRDFGTANLPEKTAEEIAVLKSSPRDIPSSWNDISVNLDGDATKPINTLDRLKYMFADDIHERLPYFGSVLGDTFNEGVTDFRSIVVDGKRVSVDSLLLFFEVPFDVDYSIDSSLAAFGAFLESNGFAENNNGVYVKGDISVLPEENSMRFFVYIWNNSPKLS